MRWFFSIMTLLLACSAWADQGTVASGNWGILWTSEATSKIMPNTQPPSGKLAAVQISAAGNEYEPFQLILRPLIDLANVKVTPRSFVGPKGAKIEAFNVTVRNVEYVNLTADNLPKGLYPDPLPQHSPFAAPKNRNTAVWITVYVPAKTPAGDYTSTVDITGKGLPTIKAPVRLRVWGFSLPTVSTLRTAYGCNMNRVAQFQGATTTDQKRKLVDVYNTNFWRHRLSPYRPYFFYDIKSTDTPSGPKLSFSDFDIAVQKYFPLFNSFELPGFVKARKSGERDPEGDQKKIEYMRAVTEHLVDKGVLDKGYDYIFDEPTPEQYKQIRDAAEVVRMTDDRIKILLTEQPEEKLFGSVDIWVPLISMYDEDQAKARQAKGEQVWWYICCGSPHPYPGYYIEDAAIEQRILPWITWRYGVNGILYWETAYWTKNPWEDAAGYTPQKPVGNGGGVLLYPPVRKPSEKFVAAGPVPSIRWELIREGMEDYDYFATLKTLADKARAADPDNPKVKQADDALALVTACAPSRTEYTKDAAQLEAARRAVARAIESLR
jgi:hypothetical protein